MDSNHRKLALTGLQPVPFSHSGTDPYQRRAFYKARCTLARKLEVCEKKWSNQHKPPAKPGAKY